MVKNITIDCSLGIKELQKQLDEAERNVKSLQKSVERAQAEASYYEKRALESPENDEAEAYWKKYDQALEKQKKYEFLLGEAMGKRDKKAEEFNVETEKGAERMGFLAQAGQNASDIMEMLKGKVVQLAKRVLIFSVITKVLRAIRSYFSEVISSNEEAQQSLGRLKGALETLVSPLVQLIIPAVVAIADWLTKIVTAVAQFIGMLTGKGLNAMKNFAKNAKKSASSFASFDTINQLGDTSNGLQAQYDFAELTNEEPTKVIAQIGLIGTAVLAWKNRLAIGKGLKEVFEYLGPKLTEIISKLGGPTALLEKMAKYAGGILLIVAGITVLVQSFKDLAENGATFKNVMGAITGILMTGAGIALMAGSWIPLLIAGIASVVFALVAVGGEAGNLVAGLKQILNGLTQFIKGVFTKDWKSAWEGVGNIFKGIFNTILSIFGGVVNAIIKGLNWIISKANGLIGDGFVSKAIGFVTGGKYSNIPTISEWKVPYLAQGAVIPPNREFLAVLGDQTSGTNIEAPLETIVEAFNMALANNGQNVEVNFSGDGASLVEFLQPSVRVYNKRRGK